jgi:hypothetical protein
MTYRVNLNINYIIKDDIVYRYTIRWINIGNKITSYLKLLNTVKWNTLINKLNLRSHEM